MSLNAGQLIDALSASLFALLGIWAAVVRRHWFLRFAVVGGLLALMLVVPAYEVVIEFGIAMALIAIGVSVARRSPAWRARWSIETALLAMVVAAVSAAVMGAAPTYGVEQWIRLVGIGITVSYFALVCLWMVCGHARPKVRVIVGVSGIIVFFTIMALGDGVLYSLFQAARQPAGWEVFLQSMRAWFTPERAVAWLAAMLPTVALGVGVMLTVIAAARASGWFTVTDDGRRSTRFAARAALCVLFIAVAAPNLYVLYRLYTPPDFPPERIPADNGFDDFVAAGREALAHTTTMGQFDYSAWADDQLADWIVKLQPVYDRIQMGLSKPSWATPVYVDHAEAMPLYETLFSNFVALSVRIEQLERRNATGALIDAYCQFIRLAIESNRGQRASYDSGTVFEQEVLYKMFLLLGALSSAECRELIARLDAIDREREPFDAKLLRERAYEYRANWQTHLRNLVAEWSGDESATGAPWEIKVAKFRSAQMRVLIADLALQAYCLDQGRPPDSLAELVPNYLTGVPVDAMCDEPLRYRREGSIYRVYSVGWNGVDDGGLRNDPLGKLNADYLAVGPHARSLRPKVRAWLDAVAADAKDWLKAAAAAASKAARPTAPR